MRTMVCRKVAMARAYRANPSPSRGSLERGIAVTPGRRSVRHIAEKPPGEGARMNVTSGPPVRIEILARRDCPNRGMARVVVDRAIAISGVPVELETVDVRPK